jgi:hypothetical protein
MAGRGFSRMSRRLVLGVVSIAVAGLLATGCDSPVDLDPDLYTLTGVNGQSLPAPYPDPFLPADSPLQVASGTLRLNDDTTVVMELVIQCATSLPPGMTCEVEGDGRRTHKGYYSVPDQFVHLDGRTYPAEFHADLVRITIQIPHSMGAWRVFVVEFRR